MKQFRVYPKVNQKVHVFINFMEIVHLKVISIIWVLFSFLLVQ